jgi:hypothetical protein
MAVAYSTGAVRQLEQKFFSQNIFRPFRIHRYETGTTLDYKVQGVIPDGRAGIKLEIEKFVGGGYAGQVYKVKLLDIEILEGSAHGLEKGQSYALKILVPPTGFQRWFRNLLFGIGFQGSFSLQSNPAAGRSQALWQKFIQRAAKIEFGSEECVVDIIATLTDQRFGSNAELSEWVEGRLWRFEVDDDLDARLKWKIDECGDGIGSPEFRAKRAFMDRFVRLMHEMGAAELARQYEWWSLKSQPNALKRLVSDPNPGAGLVAVDFRPGLAVMPFLPMCPVDFKLIIKGIGRGRLVQFDRSNFKKLERFIHVHPKEFSDMKGALEELKLTDQAYRDSLIDITFHHVRLFGRKLRRAIMNGFRQSWSIRNITDSKTAERLSKSRTLSLIFLLLPFLALAAPALFVFAWPGRIWWRYPLWLLPLLFAPLFRKLWGREDMRRHYGKMAASAGYFLRAIRAHIAESLIRWLRAGRVSETRALRLADSPLRFCTHLPASFLPAGFHRFLTDRAYFKERLRLMFIRPVKLFFNAAEREKWLRDMIAQGEQNGMLTSAEASRICSQLKEPYIQKYLKSLAVHLATLFVSETVYVTVALVYILTHPDLSWQQATLHAGAIVGALNLLPVSPGSLVRGFYVVGLMAKERNFKDYNIALGLSFLKMVGYLAFPIQMAYRYPDLAHFMAGHWATEAVHRVPVFGERGAWLEHFIFDAFYNYPLTIRRRIKRRSDAREGMKPRSWHAPLLTLAGAGLLTLINFSYFNISGQPPAFSKIWWLALWIPVLVGAFASYMAGGMRLRRRIFQGTLAGSATGLFYGLFITFGPALFEFAGPASTQARTSILSYINLPIQYLLGFGLLGVIGAIIAETREVPKKSK